MRTTSPLAGLFGKSPFKALQNHVEVVSQCATALIPLFEALAAGDRESIGELKQEIFRLEGRADAVKNEIRSNLPRSLFMPVDRRDLLDLLNAQDSIADTAQDIAGLLELRSLEIPDAFGPKLLPYVRRNVDAVDQCSEIINELDELVEAGFRGRETTRVEEMIDELGAIETETDDLGMELTSILFQQEDTLRPLALILWYELIRDLGDIADYAEDVGDRLRLLIAR